MSSGLTRDKMHFSYLTEDYAEEAIQLFTNNFVHFNSIWKKLKVPEKEAEAVMKARVYYALDKPWSTVRIY